MEQSQQQQTAVGGQGNRVQTIGSATQNDMPNSINVQQQQRRSSASIQGCPPDIPQNSPVPAVYGNNPSQIQNQQLNYLQMPSQLQTQQHYQFNQQHAAVQMGPSMQQQVHILNPAQVSQQSVTAPSSGQPSESNSLNPSPVSQPAVINQLAGQQHVLQPILTYQQPHQPQQQGIYTQQPVATLPTPILYANAALIPPGHAVHAAPLMATNEPSVAPPPGSPTEVVKRGRFRITKGAKSLNNLADHASPNEVARKELVDTVPASEYGSTAEHSSTQIDSSTMKKKGRFVVKTAKGDAQADKVGNNHSVGKTATNNQNVAADVFNVNNAPVNVKTNKSNSVDVPVEVLTANEDGLANKQIDPNNIKKKGRFVIKKGGNIARSSTPPPQQHHDTSSLDGSVSKQSIPTVVSAITSGFQDAALHAPTSVNPNMILPLSYPTQQQLFTQPIINQAAVNGQVPVANIQPVGAYDVNGNLILMSAQIMTPQNLSMQQTAQSMTTQPSPIAAHQTQQSARQAPPAISETQKPKKPAPPKTLPRPEGITSSRPSLGGRIFGTSGVGKVLHHLESVRLEVLEADKSLASLQSENKILVNKNKELEARNAKLERQLAEERAKNRKHTKAFGQNAPENQGNQVKKNTGSANSFVSPSAATEIHNDAKKTVTSDSSVDSISPPKHLERGQNQEERTPTKLSQQFVEDTSVHTIDEFQKGNPSSKVIDCNDSASLCTVGSLPSSPRPIMMPEASSLITTSDAACNQSELLYGDNAAQHVAMEFDPLVPVPTGVSIANGAVVVPVLMPTPSLPEKEIKRFDPLGTPKRSGSKVFPNSGVQACSELNDTQEVSAYAVPQIDAAAPFVAAAPMMPQPPLIQQQQPYRHQQHPQSSAQNQQEPPDPFDEIALRHGSSQANSG